MAKIEKAFRTVTGHEEKSLSAKHQIGVLGRKPAPEAAATTSTSSADSSASASGKEEKK